MSDWDKSLDPEEQEVWEAFVQHAREDAAQKIMESAFVVSLMPRGEVDIKYAVELGLSIMLDKPILVVAHPDATVPRHLKRVADSIVYADLDTEEGREIVATAIQGWEAVQF